MKISFFAPINKAYQEYESSRRKVGALSNEALSMSKKAIFAVHRDDVSQAEKLLADAEKKLQAVEKMAARVKELAYEGSYRAALEENTEALLMVQYAKKGAIGKLPKRNMDPKVLIGGLSDFTGELVRYAVKLATAGDESAVKKAKATAEEVLGFLLDLDLTGPLRQKFDQAKRNIRQMEDIMYDLSLRKR